MLRSSTSMTGLPPGCGRLTLRPRKPSGSPVRLFDVFSKSKPATSIATYQIDRTSHDILGTWGSKLRPVPPEHRAGQDAQAEDQQDEQQGAAPGHLHDLGKRSSSQLVDQER